MTNTEADANTGNRKLKTGNSPPARGVVLASGGMDSCVTMAIAARECDEIAALHVGYGQRTEARELRAFNEISDFYQIERRLTTSIMHLAQIGGSSLTDRRIEVSRADLESKEIPTSYVPFRNAHLLSIAVSWAEVIVFNRIYIGAVEEDSSGYPDCRPEFYEVFNRLIEVGTRPETHIRIRTPVIHMKKGGIVRLGVELGAPLHLSWSCYRETEIACGQCDSCALRLRGFEQAGISDPLPYRKIV
ncbi:MAG: 7-cyano-7-deazaguanine synthase QueC [Acidobacteriota bacterium]|nr:MAG: 7-cyano-7-deazaguanine synthase QueC [Acidobacteriota bacterium]